jgi:3-oxoacyl-[acyl-carrier protein] reductase
MSRTILITGASSDIGQEVIRGLDAGDRVLAHYNRSEAALMALAKEVVAEIVPLQSDLSSDDDVQALLDRISGDFGCPDAIACLAAAPVANIRFKDIEWGDFQRDIDISLKSSVQILNRFLPIMAKARQGKVVMMLTSYVIGVPPTALSHYTTVKYAVLGLMKALAAEYATRNIQINAVSPSMVDTKFLAKINEKMVEMNAHNHPLKRNGQVRDVAPIIRMLLSHDSDFMTGLNVPITGGSVF